MEQQLHLTVSGYPDSDDEERAELAGALRAELLAEAMADVSHPPARGPEGAKGSALEWAQLIVALTGPLPAVVGMIRSWLGRHPGATLTLKLDGDEITIAEPTDSERAALLEAWLSRHGRP
ncbi:MAG: effector-associated constant component EACC1 [Solirubrobacteraceae bacterium]